MKILRPNKIIVVLFFFFVGIGIQSTQAQFWKKLEKRISEEVEEAVIRKTAEKTVEKAENSIDSIFEVPSKTRKKRRRKKKKKRTRDNDSSENQETVYDENDSNEHEIETEETIEVYNETEEPDSSETNTPKPASGSYSFEWKYVLKMESAQTKKHKEVGEMKITYYLSRNSSTFASRFEMGGKNPTGMDNMLMIMDLEIGANMMLMEMDGQKFIQEMPSILSQDIDQDMEGQSVKDYTIVKTDTKTILGYQCQGFKVTSKDGIVHMYVAKDAPVSFNNAMAGNSKFKPKGFNPKWLKEFKNGLMLEMNFVSSKRKKHNIKMTCVELVKEPFSINLSAYKSFMEMGDK